MGILVRELIEMGIVQLERGGVEVAGKEAEILYRYLMKLDRVGYLKRWSKTASDREIEQYLELIEKRAARQPLQYITGKADFMGLSFMAREGVLIPRFDTETLAERASEFVDSSTSVLDLCCGSGILGIYLSKHKGAKVTCIDVSEEAVDLTKANADFHGVKIEIKRGNLFEPIKRKKYNIIVSNPPYIPSKDIKNLQIEVRDYEPVLSLDGGNDGLDFYRRIAEEAPKHLKKRGRLMFEIGADQAGEVNKILAETEKFEEAVVHQDLSGRDRVVESVLKGRK